MCGLFHARERLMHRTANHLLLLRVDSYQYPVDVLWHHGNDLSGRRNVAQLHLSRLRVCRSAFPLKHLCTSSTSSLRGLSPGTTRSDDGGQGFMMIYGKLGKNEALHNIHRLRHDARLRTRTGSAEALSCSGFLTHRPDGKDSHTG